MEGSDNGGGAQTVAVPAPLPNTNAPPPFLSKTYDMVDDPATDAIVSWSPTNNSFVVWNPPEFGRDLLPKYFKHNNFSSFVRQLNTYGFRKVDPDRWEFANEGFLRGQKHLLKGINRRKPAHVHGNQQSQQPHSQSSSVGACVEVGKFGLEEEVERLKRDKNVLMQELVRLRQQQQSTDNQLQTMVQRLQGMEQRQQQMMSFLAKAVQSPGFLAQFMQQQNDNSRRISDANKKRRLRPDSSAESDRAAVPDGQIVKYQPPLNDSAKALLRHFMNVDTSSKLESFNDKTGDFLVRDASSSPNAIDSGSSSNRVSGVTLQEVSPTSSFIPPAAGFSGHGAEEVPSTSVPPTDVTMADLSHIPEMIPESVLDTPEENYTGPDLENGGFVDRILFGTNGSVPFELANISPDPDIDAMLENSAFWNELFVQSPLREEEGSTTVNDLMQGSDVKPVENGWDKSQNMDQLTEQMGHLASDTNEDTNGV